MIPKTFEQWRNCIVNDCKINLTGDFAKRRLEVYQNAALPETKQFARLYGEEHLQNVIRWFSQVV